MAENEYYIEKLSDYTPEDLKVQAAGVAKLAYEIWHDYYDLIIGAEQVEYMLNKFLSAEQIYTDIRQNGTIYYIAKEKGQDKLIGFSGLIIEADSVFASKLYVLKEYRGKGIGRLFFEEIKSLCRKHDLPKIRLTVNKNNDSAIMMYDKAGFKNVDSICVDIGGGFYMDDYVMELDVKNTEKKVTGLKKPELLYVPDEQGSKFFGGNQYWYPKGDFVPGGACGATTASNILAYILLTRPELLEKAKNEGLDGLSKPPIKTSKADFIGFMKKVYRYFSPSIIGLHAPYFLKGMQKLSEQYGFSMSAKKLSIPVRNMKRPPFSDVIKFIRAALEADIPVAYLILSTGGVQNLYKWHWVTIIGLDNKNKKIRILDNTQASWVELDAWLEKSRLGGAFIRILI